MKRSIGYTLLLLGVTSAASAQVERTRPVVPRKLEPLHVEAGGIPSLGMMPGFVGFGSVEGLLRRKEELKLTDQQVAQIEAIRKDEVARRQAESRELIDLQSRVAAGLVERTEYRDEMEKRGDAQRVAARNVRNRLEQILNDEQLDQIERRPFMGKFPLEPGMMKRTIPREFPFDDFDFLWPSFSDAELPAAIRSLRSFRSGIL